MTAQDGERFLVVHKGGGDAEVIRVGRSDASPTGWVEESRHVISGDECDCDSFKFRKRCHHMDAARRVGCVSVPVEEARAILQEVVAAVPGLGLTDEPYERDKDGLVSCLRLRLAGRSKYGEVESSWRGLRVRVVTGS